MNRVSEPLVRSEMAITVELKLCLSNLSKGIERQKVGYQGANITLIFKTRLTGVNNYFSCHDLISGWLIGVNSYFYVMI